jgi:hypothetical protein
MEIDMVGLITGTLGKVWKYEMELLEGWSGDPQAGAKGPANGSLRIEGIQLDGFVHTYERAEAEMKGKHVDRFPAIVANRPAYGYLHTEDAHQVITWFAELPGDLVVRVDFSRDVSAGDVRAAGEALLMASKLRWRGKRSGTVL